MKKIRWAVIGAGGIADRRAIPGLLKDSKNEIVAVMDANADTAKAVAEKYGFENHFSDEELMLKSVRCDAVYIATPVFCHYKQAMLALKYGCHVFIEKPIALSFTEGKKMLDAFKKKGKQLSVGYMMGHHNLQRKARDIIAGGGIGDINLVRMQFSCWYPDIEGAWRQTKALGGGGCIMDLAVHCMELVYSVLDDSIDKCQAFFTTKTFNYEVEDSAVITFKTKKGAIGHIDVNFNVPDNAALSTLEILGTAGSLTAKGTLSQVESGQLRYVYSPQSGYEANQNRGVAGAKTYYGAKGNMYTKQFAAFTALISNNKTDYQNAERALEIQGICDKIYKSNNY